MRTPLRAGPGSRDRNPAVLGTREALFSLVQCLVDPTVKGGAKVVMPVPFYQIYEGATFLAGADPVYLPLTRENGYKLDLSVLSPDTLSQTQLVYICSPGNPTGSVFDLDDWNKLFALSDRYGFVIASDECYSEIYFEEGNAPIGAMTAAKACGRTDLKNIIVLNSLSSAAMRRVCAAALWPVTARSSPLTFFTAPITARP